MCRQFENTKLPKKISRRDALEVSGIGLACVFAPSALGEVPNLVAQATKKSFDLQPTDKAGQFHFETERILGTIDLNGAYHGMTRLVDKQTSQQVIDSRYSALNLFRLFSVNQGMGQPRTMPRELSHDAHSATAYWPATDAHQGKITARYEVAHENAVDLTVTASITGNYPGYEIFLSSYFDKRLRPHVYLQPVRGSKVKEPDLIVPYVNDVFRGTLLVFPRDSHAARLCVDGRWDRSEFGAPTVQTCPVRRYAHCLAFEVDPETNLAAILMAREDHCYALSTRYHADDDADRLTSYSAIDMSLFGNDMVVGETRTVKVRLALTHLDETMSQPLALYRQFLSEAELPSNS